MNIEDLTIKQVRELQSLISKQESTNSLSSMIGKKCIVRTYSAGVWFGEISEKSGTEVIVKNARRMYQWWAAESISLSGVAAYGIIQDKSKICPAVEYVWLDAIELIPATDVAIKSIEGAKDVKAS